MIQRIQSVFLLVATLCLGLLFKVPLALSDKPTSPLFEDSIFNVYDHIILLILAGLGTMVTLINIFMFRNRMLQLRMGYVGIICSLFLAIVAFWLVYSNAQQMNDANIEDQFGIYLPAVALIFIILSNRFIKKDKDLVESMDRLR